MGSDDLWSVGKYFARLATERLVVLGRPGAGETVHAIKLVPPATAPSGRGPPLRRALGGPGPAWRRILAPGPRPTAVDRPATCP
jgi:hypothetical protein